GSGAPAFRADVAVEGERIAAASPGLRTPAGREIDATGLYVTPGFIDIHSHSDLFFLDCPSAESKVRQGVTTEVVGMCGFSPAPVHPGRAAMVEAWMGGIGTRLKVEWKSFGEYLERLKQAALSVNVVHFVGHGALRLAVMGPDNRAPAPDEQKAMQTLLAEALDAGAFGYSTGLVYPPSAYARTEELVLLARFMAARGGLYFSHIRGEAGMLEDAVREAIDIGEAAGVPIQIAHIKAAGQENWGKMDRALRMIDEARARGVDVTADCYPYAAASTKMDALLPAWVHDGGVARLLQRLGDRDARRSILDECALPDGRWRTQSGSVGWDEILIATCPSHELEGLSLAELARRRGEAPAEAMLGLLAETRAGVSMVIFTMAEANVAKAVAHPHVMIGSDSLGLSAGPGPHHGKPHPRMYGTFPRVLCHYVREARLLSWETAINKMTGMPAAKLGLKGRGLVRPGFAADLVVFDPETVKDEATYKDPHRYPSGIPYVVVNGRMTVDGGAMKPLLAGRILTPSRM
ncbi:MAG: D-aminoacylase, partial [candidate division NC10 bacterium]